MEFSIDFDEKNISWKHYLAQQLKLLHTVEQLYTEHGEDGKFYVMHILTQFKNMYYDD